MDDRTMIALADEVLAAWNTQDVGRVLACYTEDLTYRDPNTRGTVRGREAMGRYLRTLFAAWTMTWTRRHAHRLTDGAGCVLGWRASFQRIGGTVQIDVSGMDLVLLRGRLIATNEVFFDRTVLAAAGGAALQPNERSHP